MVPKAAEVRLRPEDRAVLEARLRAPTSERRDVLRARIVLLADAGGSTGSIARAVGVMPRTVSLWRGRCAGEGLAEKPRRGPQPKYDAQRSWPPGRRILAVPEGSPPAGFARWTGPLIAAALGDVPEQQMWRLPHGRSASILRRASRGARATIPNSPSRPPRSSGSTWPRPTTPSSSVSTKSPPSRRWSARKAT